MKSRENIREWHTVDILGEVHAGKPEYNSEEYIDKIEVDLYPSEKNDCFGLKIKGDSMSPRLEPGDVVIIRRQRACDDNDLVAVSVDNNAATVKQLKKTEKGIELHAFNKKYKPIKYTNNEIEEKNVVIMGKVIRLIAGF